MSIEGKREKILSTDGERDAFVVSFTNGALEQLEELKDFLDQDELLDVIKFSIAMTQKAKEIDEEEIADQEVVTEE